MQFQDHQSSVTESSEDGRAIVDIYFQSERYQNYFKLEQEQSQWLAYGKNQQCADGIFVCLFDDDGQTKADIVIVELKSKLSSSKWNEILGQYRGSILRAISFCGTIGISYISNVKLYCCATDTSKIDSEYAHLQAQKRVVGPIRRKQKTGAVVSNLEKWGRCEFSPFPTGSSCRYEYIQLKQEEGGVNIGKVNV